MSKKIQAINIGFMTESWNIKEDSGHLPTGEIGSLAQRGVEELEDPSHTQDLADINNDELRPTNVIKIITDLIQSDTFSELGFTKVKDFHSTVDGAVALFNHKDGNTYKLFIRKE